MSNSKNTIYIIVEGGCVIDVDAPELVTYIIDDKDAECCPSEYTAPTEEEKDLPHLVITVEGGMVQGIDNRTDYFCEVIDNDI